MFDNKGKERTKTATNNGKNKASKTTTATTTATTMTVTVTPSVQTPCKERIPNSGLFPRPTNEQTNNVWDGNGDGDYGDNHDNGDYDSNNDTNYLADRTTKR